ncbi:flagellar hook-length control protein FliK [Paraburkholderia flagellata]|uniref:flagellar hook-length control protein FliK n=1 Tax=Paraburkholderia flagellata TaxID=2883241 RepID=UPI001F3DF26F|nr:flagellar hook-length control protein FliK [Paraburkholderia flagellata]
MNGIDTGAAALLASRIAALTPVGPQGASGAAQTGVSALATGTAALADTAASSNSTQDSTQTVLSAVAIALDAIVRSGGEATPAVVGSAPLWANPDADAAPGGAAASPLPGFAGEEAQAVEAALLADVALAAGSLAGDAPAGTADAGTASSAQTASPQSPQAGQSNQTAQTAQTTQTAAAAQAGPVAALAASLAQTVSTSGLFYEAHLAQWLRGQISPAELADEPQNRLLGGHSQLPLDWSLDAEDIDDVQWTETFSNTPGSARGDAGNAPNAASAVNAALARAFPALAELHGEAATAQTQARAALADTLLPAMHEAAAQAAGPTVHPAVIPLVRQQLDLLATGEFRWNGEAWPGVRVDWSIQQDDYDARDPHSGASAVDADDIPWRTRLTLALPKLGTVDAELTLTGSTLAVRVQASAGGAARLTSDSESLRGRLEALGLTLAGLSIREIGSGAAASPAEAARAASAYAAQDTSAASTTQAAQAGAAPDASATRTSADANDHRNQDWEL